MIKLYRIVGSFYDVFQGEGWENWTRISIKRGRVNIVAGIPLTAEQIAIIQKELHRIRRDGGLDRRDIATSRVIRAVKSERVALAEATAQLSHPHILPVHAVGEHNGQLYLALQYVEGCNLAQLLDRVETPTG